VVFEWYRGIGVCRVGTSRASSRRENTGCVGLGITKRLRARESRSVKLVPREAILKRRDDSRKDSHGGREGRLERVRRMESK
jgi:hypothetical protein